MHFDVTTMILLLTGTCTIAAGALLAEWRKGREPALAWWSAGFFAISLSGALTPLRQIGLDFLSIVVANMLMAGGYGALLGGIARFTGRDRLTILWAAGGIVWLAFWLFCPLFGDVSIRVIVISLISSGYCAGGAILFLSSARSSTVVRVLGWLFAVRACFLALRAASVSFDGAIVDVRMMSGFAFSSVLFEGVLASVLIGYLLLSAGRERRENSLKHLAETDYLTGIDNRRAFSMKARMTLALSARKHDREHALLILDLDKFKQLNDGHGHSFGDEILRLFAGIVSQHLRPNDLFGRLGGEEFAVLLPAKTADEAAAVANLIRRDFAIAAETVGGRAVGATVSIGVASTGEADSLEALLSLADAALYRAKAGGRNRVVVSHSRPGLSEKPGLAT